MSLTLRQPPHALSDAARARRIAVAACLVLSCAWPAPAAGQKPDGAGERTLDARARRESLDSIARLLEWLYVSPDTGKLIASHLCARARAGAYEQITSFPHLAEVLTSDLQSINGDGHLYVIYDREAAALPTPAPAAPSASPNQPARPPRSPLPAAPSPRVPSAAELEQARRTDYGFEHAERLEGNVGYLEVRGLSGLPEAFRLAAAAMTFLANTDAMILDLRRAPGGSAEMSNLLTSYFFGPDTVHTLSIYDRATDSTMQRYTLAQVPGPRRPDVDLYILTSRGTASAAEEVTFVLKQAKRATIVGARTAGAGHMNGEFPVGHGLTVSISLTRVYDPRTRKEWERVGVQPDLVVPPDEALVVAHAEAVKRLAAKATTARRKTELTWVADMLEAIRRPVRVSPATLARYAGTYGGRVITLDGARLFYQRRADAPRLALVPLSDTLFALDGIIARVAFGRGATGQELRVLTPDGQSVRYVATERTGSAGTPRSGSGTQ